MKANELMIGDWVMVAHSGNATHYAKVTALQSSGAIECELDGCGVLCRSVEPIPITPEILEKNGWRELPWDDVKYYPGIDKQYRNDDCTDTLRISYRESIHSYNILNDEVRVNNVHELQHVMNMLFGYGDYKQNILI